MFTIKIAGLNISIINKYDFVKNICKDYIVDVDDVDFQVSVSDLEFKTERQNSDSSLSDGYIESICIYRSIAKQLPYHNAFVLHCAAVEYDGKAFCFAAKSGTGKTTHIRLWRKLLGDKVTPINGDKPIVRIINNEIYVFGTPWSGKEMFNTNTFAPLKAVCFLSQSNTNSISPLNKHQALTLLLNHIFVSDKAETNEITLQLLSPFINKTSFWALKCNISEEAAKLSFDTMYNEDI